MPQRHPRPASRPLVVLALLLAAGPAAPRAAADRVDLSDGRVLEGRFVMLPGVALDPAIEAARGNPTGTPSTVNTSRTPWLLCTRLATV